MPMWGLVLIVVGSLLFVFAFLFLYGLCVVAKLAEELDEQIHRELAP